MFEYRFSKKINIKLAIFFYQQIKQGGCKNGVNRECPTFKSMLDINLSPSMYTMLK